jgi:hypothetical protein
MNIPSRQVISRRDSPFRHAAYERRGLLLLMTLLMLSLFMAAGSLMLTIAIRARLAARANFSTIQQATLADVVPREALDEALLAAIRGSISGTGGSVVVDPNAPLECLLSDKYGDPISATGLRLSGTTESVMKVVISSLAPAVAEPSRLNGRLLTIKPKTDDADVCTFRILGSGTAAAASQYDCYVANLPGLRPPRLPAQGTEFDVIINGREFTPVESGTTPEAWDGFDDQNKWLAQPIVHGGLIERMERVSFGGAGQTLTVDNDNDGILDGIWLPASLPNPGATHPYVIANRPSPLGGTLRFQVSYLILDLDGRVNINAAGNNASPVPGGYPSTPAVPLGMGYGPADIDCARLFPRGPVDPTTIRQIDARWDQLVRSGTPTDTAASPNTSQRRRQPLVGAINGRYGEGGTPGRPLDDSTDANNNVLNQRTSGERYNTTISGTGASGTKPVADLKAITKVYMTAPAGDSLTPTLNFFRPLTGALDGRDYDYVDDPYEIRLDGAAPRTGMPRRNVAAGGNDDNVFTLEELERILRPNDPDITGRPQRLAAGLESLAGESRMYITSDSWDSPALKGLAARKVEDFMADSAGPLLYSGTGWISGTAGGSVRQVNAVSPDVAAGLKFDVNRPVLSGTSFAARQDQHEYCKGLYSLVRMLGDSATPPISAVEAAQWAVNVLDFRDEDSACTGFEYDKNPWNGWDVDGDPATPETDSAVVWGAERPEIVIAEAAAWRDSMQNPEAGELFVTLYRPAADALRTRHNGSTVLDDPAHVSAFGDSLDLAETRNGEPVWRLRFESDSGAAKYVEFRNPPAGTNAVGSSAPTAPRTLQKNEYLCIHSNNPQNRFTIDASLDDRKFPIDPGVDFRFAVNSTKGTVAIERLANPQADLHPDANPYVTFDTVEFHAIPDVGAGTGGPLAKKRRKGPQDAPTPATLQSVMSRFWKQDWETGGTALSTYVTSGNYTGTAITPATAPVAWFHWPNRPFISQAELLLVPSGTASPATAAPSAMLRDYSFPSNFLSNTARTVSVNGQTKPLGGLILDATHVPSRFAENAITISGAQSNVRAVGLDVLRDLQLSKWREPGRVNVNTTISGTASPEDDIVWQLLASGTTTPNPFKASPASAVWDVLTLSGTSAYQSFTSAGGSLGPRDRNPFLSAARAIRLANTATTTSNVFAIWVTVRITDDSPNASPRVRTKRLFAIVDRSLPVGYKPNEDLNVQDCIRLKRYLD